jgi:hypothetical protein
MQNTLLEETGPRPTEQNSVFMNGEWWYTGQADGRRRIDSHRRKNYTRMFVNGQYIPKSHPLHQAGRYKSWDDAHSHNRIDKVKEGYVYAVTNPAWPNWVKVGMALDADDRCRGYQTSSPYRDYEVKVSVFFEDRSKAEQQVHKLLSEVAAERRGEWFKIDPITAIGTINYVCGDV